MVTLLISLLFLGALVMAGIGICKAFSLIAAHVQSHPEAGNAIYEHVFLPVFGSKKEPSAGDHPAKTD